MTYANYTVVELRPIIFRLFPFSVEYSTISRDLWSDGSINGLREVMDPTLRDELGPFATIYTGEILQHLDPDTIRVKQYFPYFVDATPENMVVLAGRNARDPDLRERMGDLAAASREGYCWPYGAKWDFYGGFWFRDEIDAVYFKLRYC